ncbi:unnamed protein product [Closterium sp. NIES-54]
MLHAPLSLCELPCWQISAPLHVVHLTDAYWQRVVAHCATLWSLHLSSFTCLHRTAPLPPDQRSAAHSASHRRLLAARGGWLTVPLNVCSIHPSPSICTALHPSLQIDIPLHIVHLTDAYWQRVVAHCVGEIHSGRTPPIPLSSYTPCVCPHPSLQISVPLHIVHLTDAYWQRVVTHCVGEIRSGRTPNPDMLCNSRIKFGAFYDHLDFTHFDRVASGHYARVARSPADPQAAVRLVLSADEVKDQTYFLSHLSQQQLSRVMFPLGALTKSQVRQLAAAFNLPNQSRKDSQGICFLGKVKFPEFVARHVGEQEGLLVEAESGEALGVHRGFWFFTIGQRQGIKLSGGPWEAVGMHRGFWFFTIGQRQGIKLCGGPCTYSGEALGVHRGFWFFTIGQRQGIKLSGGPCHQACTGASGSLPSGSDKASSCLAGRGPPRSPVLPLLSAAQLHTSDPPDSLLLSLPLPSSPLLSPGLFPQVRHGPQFYPCSVQFAELPAAMRPDAMNLPPTETGSAVEEAAAGEAGAAEEAEAATVAEEKAEAAEGAREGEAAAVAALVTLSQDDQGLAAGQFAAFYDGDTCLGSGVIIGVPPGDDSAGGMSDDSSSSTVQDQQRSEQGPGSEAEEGQEKRKGPVSAAAWETARRGLAGVRIGKLKPPKTVEKGSGKVGGEGVREEGMGKGRGEGNEVGSGEKRKRRRERASRGRPEAQLGQQDLEVQASGGDCQPAEMVTERH